MGLPAENIDEENTMDSGPGTSPTSWRSRASIAALSISRSSEGCNSMVTSARCSWGPAPGLPEREERRGRGLVADVGKDIAVN